MMRYQSRVQASRRLVTRVFADWENNQLMFQHTVHHFETSNNTLKTKIRHDFVALLQDIQVVEPELEFVSV